MSENIITKIFGSKHERDIKKIKPRVEEINPLFEEYESLSDEELKGKTGEFKQRIKEYLEPYQTEGTPAEELKKAEQEILDQILPEAFAVVKETCRRLVGKKWEVCGIEIEWDMVPFDVQLIGAVVLHQGKISEMATGEGKT
ncbi:MAG TPA: preprotein translocase subunit SecA, partial [candidate division Zixibacteria bacterium]